MCGIAGAFGSNSAQRQSDIEAIVELMHHRGPDGRSVSNDGWYVLGHNRLAIVDLSPSGEQPFTSAGRATKCVYNGEIYNHDELREKHGIRTPSTCDGAVLPELWALFGERTLNLLRGMFAIAMVDEKARTLTLATDVFGIKPCYWADDNGTILFASEAKALARVLRNRDISIPAIATILQAGAMPAHLSPYARINRVAPGSWIRFALDGSRTEGRIASIEPRRHVQDADVDVAFRGAVSAHLMADVPIGLLLSDGVDSTAIALAAARLGASLHCVTLDMGGARSAASAAARVAKRCAAEHAVVRVDPSSADIASYFSAMDRPTIDGLNTFLACQAVASQGLKVTLSGAGGDEILGGGYWHHRLAWAAVASPDLLNLLSRKAAQSASYGQMIPKRAFSAIASVGWPTDVETLVTFARTIRHDRWTTSKILELAPQGRYSSRDASRRQRESRRTLLLRAESDQYLTSQLLPDSDAFSMAHSVELRVPFVDRDFAAIAWTAPWKRRAKQKFSAAFGDELLISASQLPKEGFGVPMDRWMRDGPLASYVSDVERKDSAVAHLLGQDTVRTVTSSWRRGVSRWSVAWSLAALEAWLCTA